MSVEYRILNNGCRIPPLGLGTSSDSSFLKSDPHPEVDVERIVRKAIDVGYRLIDTAFFYDNEVAIGKAVRAAINENVVKREDLFIVSKLHDAHHRPEDVLPAIEKSLQNLQLDFLDLYLIHKPFPVKAEESSPDAPVEDKSVSLEDTWCALEEGVKQGYAKGIGLSNCNSQQIERILKIATIKPVVNEVECHPYFPQEKLRDYCKQNDIAIMAYAPLGASQRTGSQSLFKEQIIEELAEKYKKTAAQIILRYLVQCEVIPIPKTYNEDRLKSNFDVFDFIISSEDFEKMRSLCRHDGRVFTFLKYKNFREYPFNIEF